MRSDSGHQFALDLLQHLGERAMREFTVGLGVVIVIALCIIYTYQPSLYES